MILTNILLSAILALLAVVGLTLHLRLNDICDELNRIDSQVQLIRELLDD